MRQDVEPSVEAPLPRDDLAQPLAALAHQHPAAVPVDADEGGNEVWAHASENLDDPRLVREERSVRLEPEFRGGRGHAHRRRPGTEMWLLDRARSARTQLADTLVDPRMRLGEPRCIRPVGHGETVVGQDVWAGGQRGMKDP